MCEWLNDRNRNKGPWVLNVLKRHKRFLPRTQIYFITFPDTSIFVNGTSSTRLARFISHFRVSHANFTIQARTKPQSNWRMDKKLGYELPQNGEPPYPRRVHSTGLQFSLVVVLKMNNRDVDHLCGGSMQGFKILFHAPYQNLNAARRSFHLSPGQSTYYTIAPNLIWTSSRAQQYSPDVRRCYLNSERRLRFFKFYSQRNCEVECLSNYTLAQCGCVLFSVPRTKSIDPFANSFPTTIMVYVQLFISGKGRLEQRFVDQRRWTVLTWLMDHFWAEMTEMIATVCHHALHSHILHTSLRLNLISSVQFRDLFLRNVSIWRSNEHIKCCISENHFWWVNFASFQRNIQSFDCVFWRWNVLPIGTICIPHSVRTCCEIRGFVQSLYGRISSEHRWTSLLFYDSHFLHISWRRES